MDIPASADTDTPSLGPSARIKHSHALAKDVVNSAREPSDRSQDEEDSPESLLLLLGGHNQYNHKKNGPMKTDYNYKNSRITANDIGTLAYRTVHDMKTDQSTLLSDRRSGYASPLSKLAAQTLATIPASCQGRPSQLNPYSRYDSHTIPPLPESFHFADPFSPNFGGRPGRFFQEHVEESPYRHCDSCECKHCGRQYQCVDEGLKMALIKFAFEYHDLLPDSLKDAIADYYVDSEEEDIENLDIPENEDLGEESVVDVEIDKSIKPKGTKVTNVEDARDTDDLKNELPVRVSTRLAARKVVDDSADNAAPVDTVDSAPVNAEVAPPSSENTSPKTTITVSSSSSASSSHDMSSPLFEIPLPRRLVTSSPTVSSFPEPCPISSSPTVATKNSLPNSPDGDTVSEPGPGQVFDRFATFVFTNHRLLKMTIDATQAPKKSPMKTSYNEPRHEEDLYTPRWVRGMGFTRQGLCPICFAESEESDDIPPLLEGPEMDLVKGLGYVRKANTERSETWLRLKVSAYWYHMIHTHGISPITGRPFEPPIGYRMFMDGRKEGQCHNCLEWIALDSPKLVPVNVEEIYWYKHAQACHRKKIDDSQKKNTPVNATRSKTLKSLDLSTKDSPRNSPSVENFNQALPSPTEFRGPTSPILKFASASDALKLLSACEAAKRLRNRSTPSRKQKRPSVVKVEAQEDSSDVAQVDSALNDLEPVKVEEQQKELQSLSSNLSAADNEKPSRTKKRVRNRSNASNKSVANAANSSNINEERQDVAADSKSKKNESNEKAENLGNERKCGQERRKSDIKNLLGAEDIGPVSPISNDQPRKADVDEPKPSELNRNLDETDITSVPKDNVTKSGPKRKRRKPSVADSKENEKRVSKRLRKKDEPESQNATADIQGKASAASEHNATELDTDVAAGRRSSSGTLPGISEISRFETRSLPPTIPPKAESSFPSFLTSVGVSSSSIPSSSQNTHPISYEYRGRSTSQPPTSLDPNTVTVFSTDPNMGRPVQGSTSLENSSYPYGPTPRQLGQRSHSFSLPGLKQFQEPRPVFQNYQFSTTRPRSQSQTSMQNLMEFSTLDPYSTRSQQQPQDNDYQFDASNYPHRRYSNAENSSASHRSSISDQRYPISSYPTPQVNQQPQFSRPMQPYPVSQSFNSQLPQPRSSIPASSGPMYSNAVYGGHHYDYYGSNMMGNGHLPGGNYSRERSSSVSSSSGYGHNYEYSS